MVLAMGKNKARKRGTRGGRKRMAQTDSVNAIGDVNDSKPSDWILDSDSSRQLMNDASIIQDDEECDHEISMADGESVKISSVGSVRLQVITDGKERTITLTNVYLAPQLGAISSYTGSLRRMGSGSCTVDQGVR